MKKILFVYCMAAFFLFSCDQRMPEMKDPPRPKNLDKTAQWLGGRDGGSWFLIQKLRGDEYRIINYFEGGEVHWDAIFRIDHGTFHSNNNYEFAGTSNYTQCKKGRIIKRIISFL